MQLEKKRYPIVNQDVQDKLEHSRQQAQRQHLRTVRCPVCGFYLLDVYSRDHYLVRVKCQKCKFDDVIDIALFRQFRLREKL